VLHWAIESRWGGTAEARNHAEVHFREFLLGRVFASAGVFEGTYGRRDQRHGRERAPTVPQNQGGRVLKVERAYDRLPREASELIHYRRQRQPALSLMAQRRVWYE